MLPLLARAAAPARRGAHGAPPSRCSPRSIAPRVLMGAIDNALDTQARSLTPFVVALSILAILRAA